MLCEISEVNCPNGGHHDRHYVLFKGAEPYRRYLNVEAAEQAKTLIEAGHEPPALRWPEPGPDGPATCPWCGLTPPARRTDFTNWSEHQKMSYLLSAAEDDAHDLRNYLDDAEYQIDDPLPGETTYDAQARRDLIAERLKLSERAVEAARAELDKVQRYTRKQFADILGIAPDTLSGYVTRGQAPQPDGTNEVGYPYWHGETVWAYAERQKRPGARRDLEDSNDRQT